MPASKSAGKEDAAIPQAEGTQPTSTGGQKEGLYSGYKNWEAVQMLNWVAANYFFVCAALLRYALC